MQVNLKKHSAEQNKIITKVNMISFMQSPRRGKTHLWEQKSAKCWPAVLVVGGETASLWEEAQRTSPGRGQCFRGLVSWVNMIVKLN